MQAQAAFACDFKITRREQEVLNLIACGHSGKKIAQALLISPSTVERHIEHLRLKTRSRNRTHMIVIAAQNGLIDTLADA